MTTQQPEALRLADAICDYSRYGHETEQVAKLRRMKADTEAAAELRRLHESNIELVAALQQGVDETLDYIKRNHLTGAENNHWIVQARAAINKAERTP